MEKILWKSNSILKTLKLHNITIIMKSVFEEDSKYYPQDFKWMFVGIINARIW